MFALLFSGQKAAFCQRLHQVELYRLCTLSQQVNILVEDRPLGSLTMSVVTLKGCM